MIVIFWTHVSKLPQSSVAFQVRVIVPVLPQAEVLLSSWLMVTPPPVSESVALPVAAGLVSAVRSTVLLAGQVIEGFVVSMIVIVWTHVSKLPQSSVAFQVRVIVPVLPQAEVKLSSWLIVTPPQVSDPVALPVAAGLVSPVHSTVLLAGQVIEGFVVSMIVIVWTHVSKLPQSSVAFQVRVIVPVLPQAEVKLSSWLIVTPPQVSDPVALPVAAGLVSPVHSTVLLAGQVIEGFVVSMIVIVWTHVSKLPQSSVAFQVRVIVPVLPQAEVKLSSWLIVTPPQVSDPVALPVAAGLVSPVHSTVLLAGQVIEGFVVSMIVIVWTHVSKLPQSSVAFQVRVIVPVLPQAEVKLSSWLIVTPPQVSDPVALPVAAGLVSPVHSTVLSAGQVIEGFVVSMIVTVWTHVSKLPQSSVAFQVRVIVPVLPQAEVKLSSWLMVTPPQVSEPVALPVAAGLVSPVHSTVLSAGQVIEGLVVSMIVTVWTHVSKLPQSSVAFQ